jgi:ribulose-5-phosphate 4-epimerase/fuculose-1-phosphate aldolase
MAVVPSNRPGDRADAGIEAVAAAMVAAGRRLGARGLIAAGEGNLSVRLPDERLLVTPSGLRKDELDLDDLLIVAIASDSGDASAHRGSGGVRGRRPTSDLAIHRAVMLARPDAGAVAHAHLPAAMALTLAGEVPDPAALPETSLFLPRIPFVQFGTPGSDELARGVAEALTAPPPPLAGAAVLERHGAVALGEAPAVTPESWAEAAVDALRQAVDRLELIEVLCRATRDALLLRAARRAEEGRAAL